MKFSQNAKAALGQSDTEAIQFEMTSERRERYGRVSKQIVDLLHAHTENPAEGYMVLQLIVHSFEEAYGIRGGIIVDQGDKDH